MKKMMILAAFAATATSLFAGNLKQLSYARIAPPSRFVEAAGEAGRMAGKPELGIMAAAVAPQLEAETGKFRAGAESFAVAYAVEPEFSKAMDAFLADPEKNPPDLSEVMAFAVAIPVNSLGENAKKSGDWKMVEAGGLKFAIFAKAGGEDAVAKALEKEAGGQIVKALPGFLNGSIGDDLLQVKFGPEATELLSSVFAKFTDESIKAMRRTVLELTEEKDFPVSLRKPLIDLAESYFAASGNSKKVMASCRTVGFSIRLVSKGFSALLSADFKPGSPMDAVSRATGEYGICESQLDALPAEAVAVYADGLTCGNVYSAEFGKHYRAMLENAVSLCRQGVKEIPESEDLKKEVREELYKFVSLLELAVKDRELEPVGPSALAVGVSPACRLWLTSRSKVANPAVCVSKFAKPLNAVFANLLNLAFPAVKSASVDSGANRETLVLDFAKMFASLEKTNPDITGDVKPVREWLGILLGDGLESTTVADGGDLVNTIDSSSGVIPPARPGTFSGRVKEYLGGMKGKTVYMMDFSAAAILAPFFNRDIESDPALAGRKDELLVEAPKMPASGILCAASLRPGAGDFGMSISAGEISALVKFGEACSARTRIGFEASMKSAGKDGGCEDSACEAGACKKAVPAPAK